MLLRGLLIFGLLFGVSCEKLGKPRILVFAAASMKDVLEEIGRNFEDDCSCEVVFSFAGSGRLARQIEAGARADIYISAHIDWVEWLLKRNVIEIKTIKIIARNRLVVAIARERQLQLSTNLEGILENGRIAMANPLSVPAGKYGKQALANAGVWEKVEQRMVFGENVRVSLALVARGDVASAIVYRSDLKVEPRVKMAYLLDSKSHKSIEYMAAMVGQNLLSRKFYEFLSSDVAFAVIQKFGFTALDHGR